MYLNKASVLAFVTRCHSGNSLSSIAQPEPSVRVYLSPVSMFTAKQFLGMIENASRRKYFILVKGEKEILDTCRRNFQSQPQRFSDDSRTDALIRLIANGQFAQRSSDFVDDGGFRGKLRNVNVWFNLNKSYSERKLPRLFLYLSWTSWVLALQVVSVSLGCNEEWVFLDDDGRRESVLK